MSEPAAPGQGGQGGPARHLPWSRVRLRPVETSDAETFHLWQNDTSLRDATMAHRFPVQLEQVRKWITDMGSDRNPKRVFYAISFDDALVGYALLYDIQPIHRIAKLGVTIADGGARNASVGVVAGSLMLDFAFRALDMRKLEAESIVLALEYAGWVREGTRRQAYFAGGRVHDIHIYGMLREEFRAYPPAEAHLLASP